MPDYKVTLPGAEPMMVRGPNPSVVRNWALRDKVKVEPLTTDDTIALATAGKKLIDITAEPEAQSEAGEGDGKAEGGGADEGGESKDEE